jgi:exosortase A
MSGTVDQGRKAVCWLAFAAGLALLGVVFRPEVLAAIAVWSSSTAYGHCFLVMPIVFWLLWERREVFSVLEPRPEVWPVGIAMLLIPVWVAADFLGIMEGRQLAVIGFVELHLMAAVGWRMWWALSAAFLYLFFLVPFGAFVTPVLQQFTAAFIVDGLRILHIPFEANSFQITIPEGAFYVAEACAGLRFLIAAIAFGVLYSVTMFRSPWRRAAFITVSCLVPVVANGVRGLGIVVLGHVLGSAQAGAADHLIYGWLFFSAVILLLALVGLPFREAPAAMPVAKVEAGFSFRQLAGCAGVVLMALAGPALAAAMVGDGGQPGVAMAPAIDLPAACLRRGSDTFGPVRSDGFLCGDQRLTVTVTVLGRRSNPASILETARSEAASGLQGEVDSEVVWLGGAPWVVMSGRDQGGAAAYAVWVDGRQSVGGLRDRVAMARDMFSEGKAPVVVTIAVAPGKAGAREALLGVLAQVKYVVLEKR